MKGHPFLGAVCGFLFGLFLAGFLLSIGVLATDSVLHLVLPILFLLVGIGLAAAAPFKRSRLQPARAAASTAPPPVAGPPADGS